MKKYLLIGILFLGGCKAITLNDEFKAAYGTVKIAKMTNILLLQENAISSTDGQNIQNQCLNVDSTLDHAWSIKKAYADSARTAVQKTYVILDSITDFLKSKETNK